MTHTFEHILYTMIDTMCIQTLCSPSNLDIAEFCKFIAEAV